MKNPRDSDGILYVPLDDNDGWKVRLLRELKAAGFVVDANRGVVGMTARITIPSDRIATFCKRWRVAELALFGSVVRDDFGPDSDVDVLVSFDPGARRTLFDMVRMQDELSRIFGRKVDLVTRAAVEGSRNYIRKKAIPRVFSGDPCGVTTGHIRSVIRGWPHA